MIKIEKNVIDFIKKYSNIFFFIIVTVLAIMIRIVGFKYISDDMKIFLLPWFEEMKTCTLKNIIGDYGLLYQTIIKIMTYIPIPAIYQYKIISVIFDFCLSFISSVFICKFLDKKLFGTHFNLSYSVFLFFPTIILNSAFWGQCDSIYLFFCILALYLLYCEKYVPSFAILGVALAFKLQTVFIFPFYFYCYFQKKNFSIFNFLITFIVFMSSGIVCYIKGQKIWMPLKIYFTQTKEYGDYLFLNIHSSLVIFGNKPEFKLFALLFTLFILGIGLYIVIKSNLDFSDKKNFLMTAVWTVWVCTIFLPKMHERYTYFLDILLLILFFFDKKYLMFTIFSEISSLITYAAYFGSEESVQERRYFALVYLAFFIWFSVLFIKTNIANRNLHLDKARSKNALK